ncbi:MAG: type III-A CRISPR-associated protein Cas10/Csm1 [Armatimonadota bacterium]|nr:type III-A CRISPR-associated protein Cas10/Csm1 [Armatimonadota bacterium]
MRTQGVFTLSEFDSLICAALLHDIGKFYQRAHTQRARHWDLSGAFVEAFRESFYDPTLVKELVTHHHESSLYTEFSERPDSIADEKTRKLAYLLSQADNLSASERSQNGRAQAYTPGAPLRSVFSQIDIGRDRDQAAASAAFCYELGSIPDVSAYPKPVEPNYEHSRPKYEAHVDSFLSEFRVLFPEPYPRMGDTLLSLLQKYLWCVPSDTTLECSDISLADHAKTTCALAACFYRYHDELGWEESSVRDRTRAKVLLVSGDLSGIQDYIYGTASVGYGGVAKRLRGRSFRISLLTELIVARLLRELDIPTACNVMSAGGQFYVLVPNTPRTIEALSLFEQRLEKWLLRYYQGEITIAFASTELRPDMLAQGAFDAVMDLLHDRLASAKLRKMERILSEESALLDVEFHGRPACPVCDRLPARGDDEPQPCQGCELDAALGMRLLRYEWLAVSENPVSNLDGVEFFENPAWYAYVVDSAHLSYLNPIYCLNLRGRDLLRGVPSGLMLYSGYAPTWSDEKELEESKRRQSSTLSNGDEEVPQLGDIKTFEAIAEASEGDDLLGVLRADVDQLGLVFSLGMRGRASLSRVATVSSMLNLFFSAELVKLVSQEFPNTYIAYAGGDDLMLIGPWNDAIGLSKRLADEFTRFTARNPNLTISAAVGTCKPKVPIATSSVQAGELLQKSKSAGRNSLTVFDTTIPWNDFETFQAWADMLTESLRLGQSHGGISKAFLYRLGRYQRQAQRYFESDDTRALLFRPHLAHDIARNYTDDSGNPTLADRRLYEKLLGLLESNEKARKNWQLLKPAIAWSSYATRERKED